MVVFPNCKINLGLHITRKRDDGYHDLETVFYPLALKDALEATRSETAAGSGIRFTGSGLEVAGDPLANLCVKAYHLLRKDFPELPRLEVHLHKMIPMGAGLGGGSADGAFALKLFNQLCRLDLSDQQLSRYAVQLGSDCPFFIHNKPCLAKGRGEKIQEIPLDLSAYDFLIVDPGIHIATAKAFAGIIPHQPTHAVEDIIRLPVNKWKGLLLNDFEIPIGKQYPQIIKIREQLYAAGAAYASMTGSGSAVYGIFKKDTLVHPEFGTQYPTYLV